MGQPHLRNMSQFVSLGQAIEEAVMRTSYNLVLKAEQSRYETNCLQLTVWGWNTVHEICEMELNFLRDDRPFLALFLTQLDDSEMTQVTVI